MIRDETDAADIGLERLLTLERRLLTEGVAAYEELLHRDAIIIVPGGSLDRTGCIAAIGDTPPWDRFDIAPLWYFRTVDSEALAYRFDGTRGDDNYRALLASSYVSTPRGLLLVQHQQTPDPKE